MRATSVIRSPPIVESMHPSHVPSKPCKNKKLEDAFHMVDLMDWHGMPISRDAIYDLLQACTQQRDLEAGMHTYCLMIKNGLDSITVLVDHLIRLFVSCGSLVDARATFSKVLKPTVYTWNAIISAHDKLATSESALALYEEMQEEGTQPNSFTFLCILKACGSVASVEKGRQIHDQIIRSVLEPNLIVWNALIHMYVQCGALNEARKVFDGLLVRDVVSWGTIISGYAQHGHAVLSVELLKKMQHERIKPERVTFLCILKACGSIGSSWQGRCVHDQILKSGLESDVAVGSALVDMYAKCMSLDEAQKVFDQLPNRNVVSWGALLAGFVQHGYGLYALDLFEQMKLEIAKLDTSIFSCILKACGIVGVKGATRLIHGDIIRCGVELDTIVGSALVDTYAKCGSIEDARVVFDELPHRDVVTWGLMIEAYAQHGKSLFALALFERMQIKGIWPDKVTFLGVAKACGSLGALKQGLWIHSQVVECGLESDLLLGNTVIDMYGKCGSLEDAWEVFNKLPNRDAASWGAIIASLARFGNLRLAQQCLGDMQRHGMKPSVMIFSSIFTACSHAGHLKEGWSYFKSLKKDYDITPRVEHCNCMLDILGRLGHLHEAEHLLKTLPIPPNVVGWMALLTACKTYGNIELGTRCFKKVLVLDPDEASVYMLMSSIYAGAQMWKEVDKMNEMRSHVGAQKKPGMAWIEVSGKVNEFTVGGKSHQQSKEIIEMLQALSRLMQEEGYVPALDSVLEPMLGEVKEAVACVETMGFGFPQCT